MVGDTWEWAVEKLKATGSGSNMRSNGAYHFTLKMQGTRDTNVTGRVPIRDETR